MQNAFVHSELSVDDVAAAKKFYKQLFAWKLNDMGPTMGNYTTISYGSKTSGGGITPKMMPTQPTGWLTYVEVASVKKTMAKAAKAGGKVVVAYQDVGMGAIGIFTDPQGATLGVYEAKKASAKKAAPAKKKAAKKVAKKKTAKRK